MANSKFGTMPDGSPVELITLKHGNLSCNIITYGGALQSLKVPDKTGQTVDVLLGFDTLEQYMNQDKFFGALVGRYANRIGDARFTLNGKEYPLLVNDGKNHLHGGGKGFDKQLWTVEEQSADKLTLTLFSPDGQEGYPGNLKVRVTYRLTDTDLEIDYEAVCDSDTVCNLTNHAYFNLSGHNSGAITGHSMKLNAKTYTPTDSGSIPTGELAPVEGTPMDFLDPHEIGERIDSGFEQLTMAGGYDHNYVIDGPAGQLNLAATAHSPVTGISMDVLTTMPGIQFYSGNYLPGCPAGKGGADYSKRCGFCLETQYFPDSPNKPNFPSAVLHKGETGHWKTVYRFRTEKK